jgi:hypothetical protein
MHANASIIHLKAGVTWGLVFFVLSITGLTPEI